MNLCFISIFSTRKKKTKQKKKGSQRCSKVFVNWKIASFKKDLQHLHSPKPLAFHAKPAFNIKAPFESLWWNDNTEKGTLVKM